MTKISVQKDLGQKYSYLGLVSILAAFCVYGPVLLFRAFFNHIDGKQE